jgi:hypothetical protein
VSARVELIESEEHRHVYAAERLSEVVCDEMPEPGPERVAAVEAWLADHPEVVVGAKVAS